MKRSEMVEILRSSFIEHMNCSENCCKNDEEMYSSILKDLENTGMLPPGYMKPIPFGGDGKQYPLVPGDFKNEEGVWCTPGVNEWEPENGE